jgi:hypothetical protein
LRDHEEALRAGGALLAAVGLGDRRYAAAFRDEAHIGFPLLVDEPRLAYRAAGLLVASPLDILRPAVVAAGLRAARAGHRQGRTGQNPMQLGGSFVFGPGDVDLHVHVSSTFADNAPPDVLLAAVRARA